MNDQLPSMESSCDPVKTRALNNIRIVLVRPIYGGNVGSVCRAMANMGLSDLALAGAAPSIDFQDARKMACWAGSILEQRRDTATLAEAVSDCAVVMGATARLGLYRQHSQSPRACAPRILETAQTGKVALVFGPEDNGLSNEELEFCTHLVQIPSSDNYRSLNLSHAVMICAYELFVASELFVPAQEKSPEAPSAMKERLFAMWEQALLEIGFMEDDKAQHMMLGVRRIFSRGQLTEDDVRILMGIARQTRWCATQAQGRPGGQGS
ncbi:MAG: RNA methyltransferase [Verrucomicrobia bacterium]|nr:RNA methyltransferase [Verrucomicrobiota bacterium]MBU4289821.1 RNA methyltransferase [Verrucomicrobiota bacterium]MBU4428111.1 RNA methyltransferase [Verrucomicrobiota bacterium]MCG2679472.1 RNA methyltransferase [Kiritimatiellia bacterium]